MNHRRLTTEPKRESIRVRVNEELERELRSLSSKTGETVSEIIRTAIKEYISRTP